jgi:hypothetical protein
VVDYSANHNNGLVFGLNGTTGVCNFSLSSNGSAYVTATVADLPAPTLGTWHMFAGGYDGTQAWVTQDAGVRNGIAVTGTPFASTAPLAVGFFPIAGYVNCFTGSLACASLWTRALSTAEVTQLYNSGSAYTSNKLPFTTGLASAWNMDEPSGWDRQDTGGGGRTLTNINGVQHGSGPPFAS